MEEIKLTIVDPSRTSGLGVTIHKKGSKRNIPWDDLTHEEQSRLLYALHSTFKKFAESLKEQ